MGHQVHKVEDPASVFSLRVRRAQELKQPNQPSNRLVLAGMVGSRRLRTMPCPRCTRCHSSSAPLAPAGHAPTQLFQVLEPAAPVEAETAQAQVQPFTLQTQDHSHQAAGGLAGG